MPIHMAIMCERCRKVYFIATSPAIHFSRFGGGIYRLNCSPPCAETMEFQKAEMRPYRAADDVFRRGYAVEGECELMQSTERRTRRYLTALG